MTAAGESTRSLGARLPRWVAPLLLAFLCLLVYNANLRTIAAGDTLPARYQPLILWRDGTLALDGHARLVAHGHPLTAPSERTAPAGTALDGPAGTDGDLVYFEPWAYWMIRTDRGQLASLYPVVTPLLVAPLYLPAALMLRENGWEQPQLGRVAELMEKLSASLLAAITSVLMLVLLRREGIRWALPLALVFAFGTGTWMISSQALWQHGTGELLVALALLLAVARPSPRRAVLLGFVCALMTANRPPDALIAGAFLLFALWSRKRDARWLAVGAAPPLAALLYYNLGFVGDLAGAYGDAAGDGFFGADPLGLPGLLVSPTRGLLVFSPFLVFAAVGLAHRLRTPGTRALAVALSGGVAAQLVLYSQADWRAGAAWGPRWLTDLLPILMWMLAPAPSLLRRPARGVLVATMVAAVLVQSIGAFAYTKASDERIFADDPSSKGSAWDPRNMPFVVELRRGHAGAELQCDARGFVERIGATIVGEGVSRVELRPGATLEGWTLTCGRTPAQVLLLIDGRVIGTSTSFTPRPDVDRALKTTASPGWRIIADTRGVSPGPHVLQLAARIAPRSDIRVVHEKAVTVAPQPTLRVLAARAAQRLRDAQAGAGYWLTSFTGSQRYRAPQQEMNTYVTSLLVDLLTPIARTRRLDDAVTRARRHLAKQIEGNGLVRYHGLPDAPTIGTLGCAITPDADDTALAWRIAGAGLRDARSRPMLRTLDRYRNARGLYRTWLAPRERYQCLDPGRDPNPADLVIQMHVYLLLRELDRPAARALCEAMQRSSGDDDAFVYYAKTALVPYLRSAELARLGCPLPLPSARLAQTVPGQQHWSEVVRRLVQTAASRPDADARQAIRGLLGRIGSNDFALLRVAPPLLYHNDLSATVSRFYWSEDAGYALWLRLYEAAR